MAHATAASATETSTATTARTTTTPATPDPATSPGPGIRAQVLHIGRRWSVSLTHLVELSAELDESGEWALDHSPTCAHWLASALDVEVCTAREWLRVGRTLRRLPLAGSAFAEGTLPYTKARTLTRLATPENEACLLEIAERTPAGRLGTALAAWSARNEDEATRNRRHRRDRALRWQTQPDGMVTAWLRMTPEQAATLTSAVDAHVMRSDGRDTAAAEEADRQAANPTSAGHEQTTADPTTTESGADATRTRSGHGAWLTLAQQRIDALVHLVSNGGNHTAAEVILHVRADGCTLDDGTPIAGSVVERIATTAVLRAMIHDAEGHPINVSGRHRDHTDRQKRVVKERDRVCVDCGGSDFAQYDHVPDFEESQRTLVEETELRCSRCHAQRHGREPNLA